MLAIFILLQIILLFFMLFHDWIPVPPFNDVTALKETDGFFNRLINSFINGLVVFIPLIITFFYYSESSLPLSALLSILPFYALITFGTIMSWWVPYFFGSSQSYKDHFKKFENTHRFLPARGDNVIPNTLHFILHLQVWACLGICIYFLFVR